MLYRHALRNALIPLITLLGLSLPAIVGGALITETVFNYPGMGLLTTQAAINNDVPLLLGTTFVAAIATVVGSLIADVLYAVVDPTGAVCARRLPAGGHRLGARRASTPSPAPCRRRGRRRSAASAAQLVRVFVENRLAVVGAGDHRLRGPLLLRRARSSTTRTRSSTQNALLYSTQNAPPSSAAPARHRRERLRHARPDHVRRPGLARGRLRRGRRSPRCIGVLYGAISGFFGGWVDALLMRIVDVLLSVPILFLLIVLAVIFHPSLTILILVIGFTAWLVPARLVRGETLSLRVREYVLAVRVMGGSGTADRAAPHHPEHDRDDHRQRDLPGRRRDPAARRARLHRPRRAGAADRLGLDARRRRQLRARRLLVADLPGRDRDRRSSWSRSTSSATRCATPSRCACSGARRRPASAAGSGTRAMCRPERRGAAAPPRRRSPARAGSGCGSGSRTAA